MFLRFSEYELNCRLYWTEFRHPTYDGGCIFPASGGSIYAELGEGAEVSNSNSNATPFPFLFLFHLPLPW